MLLLQVETPKKISNRARPQEGKGRTTKLMAVIPKLWVLKVLKEVYPMQLLLNNCSSSRNCLHQMGHHLIGIQVLSKFSHQTSTSSTLFSTRTITIMLMEVTMPQTLLMKEERCLATEESATLSQERIYRAVMQQQFQI